VISLIAARSRNNVIGDDDRIPWRAKGEQALFRDITMGGVLVMGRRTYATIGRPLPGRTTVVVSRNRSFVAPGCIVCHDLADAVATAHRLGEVFIAGGGEIYALGLDLADGVHLTTVQCEAKGNVLFPPFPTADFRLVREQYHESNIDYLYQYFERTSGGKSP